jgi:hypothetical protein
MPRSLIIGLGCALLLASSGAWAVPPESLDEERGSRTAWWATVVGQYKYIPSPENDDSVGGFFDQYEYTPNKSSSFPFELGIRDGGLDLFDEGDSPLFQIRLESPTSNLGVSGSDIDQPFFNQRLDALTRLEGIDIDFLYHRIRTEQLRIFPNTEGPGLVFQDLTGANDRFYRDRTGFAGEIRVRPYQAFDLSEDSGEWLAPELSLRGGYEKREGLYQLRIHRSPSAEWLGVPQELDRSVSDVGGGLLLAPNGLLTASFDFDWERLSTDSPFITDGDLGYPLPGASQTIGFVPNTDRYSGTLQLNSRIGDRVVLEGGFQYTRLEQVPELTPDQDLAGLADNSVRSLAASAAIDIALMDDLSLNGFFKFDRRDNDIDRDTVLFDPENGSQVAPFVDHWQRFFVGAELALRLPRVHRLAIGVRYQDVERDLDFAEYGVGNRRILEENSLVAPETRIVTLYGRAAARPVRGLRLDGELGYRWAPETGYVTELDDNIYGSFRASYAIPLVRPLVLSAYVRGGKGTNNDFSMVSGQGPDPGGPLLPRSYARSNVVSGATASISPMDPISLFASFFYGQDDQDTSLDVSNQSRFTQDQGPVSFSNDGLNRYQNQQFSLLVGSHFQMGDLTDGGLSYSFTRAEALYGDSTSSANLDLVADSSVIDSYTHVVDFEIGHWVREGLRVLAGYRFQYYDDAAPVVESIASVVTPFDRSTYQHTVTFGVTLTSEFFARSN